MKKNLILFLIAVLTSGCVRLPLVVQPIGNPASKDKRENLKSILNQRISKIQNMRGLYKCNFFYGQNYSPFRQAIVASPSQGLRLETLSTGTPYSLALYVFKNGKGILLVPPEKKAEIYSDNQVPLSADMTLPIRPTDLTKVFLGVIPIGDSDQVYESEGKSQVVTKSGIEAFFSAELNDLENFIIRDAEGVGVLKGTFESFLTINDIVMPQTFTLALLEENASIKCESELQSVNDQLKDGLFNISVPAGWSKISE